MVVVCGVEEVAQAEEWGHPVLFVAALRPAINLKLSSIATLPSSQKVLARPRWQQAMTPRDYAALTPLIWSHVNPYGRFDLDMNARMALA